MKDEQGVPVAYRGPALTPKLLEIAAEQSQRVLDLLREHSPAAALLITPIAVDVHRIVKDAVMLAELTIKEDENKKLDAKARAKQDARRRLYRGS